MADYYVQFAEVANSAAAARPLLPGADLPGRLLPAQPHARRRHGVLHKRGNRRKQKTRRPDKTRAGQTGRAGQIAEKKGLVAGRRAVEEYGGAPHVKGGRGDD